jgi:hypothetical protein
VQITEIILIDQIFYSFLHYSSKKRNKRSIVDGTSSAYSFLLLVQKKRIKENTPTALPLLRLHRFYLSAARRPLRALIGAALLTVKTRNLFTLLQ